MDIMLEIVSRQKFSATFPVSHVFGEAGGYIGRSEECEWVLPDRSREISRQHALITFEDGHFYLEDVSANGVFLSLGHEPVGRNTRHRIEHGEGFVIGAYTIMARLLHNPGAYTGSPTDGEEDILNLSKGLSLDPLTAMQQGTIEGEENPINVIYSYSLWDYGQQYVTLDRHSYSTAIITMSLDVFNSLDEATQEIFLASAQEAAEYERAWVAEQEADQLAAIKSHGVEVIENPDVESLRAAVQSVYDAYPQYADYIARIQALLAE